MRRQWLWQPSRWPRFVSSTQRVWIFCDGSTGALYQDALPGTRGRSRSVQRAAAAGGTHLRAVCAAAAIARADDGRILDVKWQQLADMTNNEAEYVGLLLGIELAARRQAQTTVFVLDSEVVVGQMEGRFSVHSKTLRPLYRKAREGVRELSEVEYRNVPREWNRLADGMAAQAAIPWAALRAHLELSQRGSGPPVRGGR